ncbi:MAG: sigma-70 family RNA polymerase sigma factor [Kofleriaceae bacterium]
MSDVSAHVRGSWHQFLDEIDALRPELYRYCRYLARSPWDAEDLVQDALARAFVSLGQQTRAIESSRAWLFRIASNLWLNRVRHARVERGHAHVPSDASMLDATPRETAGAVDPRETREAAGTLLAQLAPQERAAVVLKDVFDFSLDDIADLLSTTRGAIKAALHRGRGKLADPEEPAPNPVEKSVLDALCAAFNARDLDRVASLLLESAVVEYPGVVVEYGREAAREGTLRGALFGCDDPAILAAAPPGHRLLMTTPPRCEVRVHRGEPIMLCWWRDAAADTVRAIVRVDVEGDRIVRMRTYMHSPELLVEVGKELDVPIVTTGYH